MGSELPQPERNKPGKDIYSQPCGCSCVASHASVGLFWVPPVHHHPPGNPKPGAHHQQQRSSASSDNKRMFGRSIVGVRPQNRLLAILIPPAHTHPAILPLGDGSLCHPHGCGVVWCGVWAGGFLYGSYLGVGWDGTYLTARCYRAASLHRYLGRYSCACWSTCTEEEKRS